MNFFYQTTRLPVLEIFIGEINDSFFSSFNAGNEFEEKFEHYGVIFSPNSFISNFIWNLTQF